jgi:hypothetical protein
MSRLHAVDPNQEDSMMPDSSSVNRREFAARLASAVAPMVALGTPDAGACSEQAAGATETQASLVDRLVDVVRQQYPDARLDAAALQEIRSELEDQLERSKKLSEFPLANADEPGFVFRTYRKD